MSADLFSPYQMGDLALANRLVMAPMTRNRATEDGVVPPMTTSAGTVDYRALKQVFTGTYIADNGYDLSRAMSAVAAGSADRVSFGAPFLANPDLVRRYRESLPLNVPDPSTFYTGGEDGYNDYPAYTGAQAAA